PFLLPQSSPEGEQLFSANFSQTRLWASVIFNFMGWESLDPQRNIFGRRSPSMEQLTISPCTSLFGSASLLLALKKSTIGLVCVAPKRSTLIISLKPLQGSATCLSTI